MIMHLFMSVAMMLAPQAKTDGRKGNTHSSKEMREAAIHYHETHPDWDASTIVQELINHHGLTVPLSENYAKATESLHRKIRRWIQRYKASGSHLSARQAYSAKIEQRKQDARDEKLRIKRRRGESGMSLAERTFMCSLLLENPETSTQTLQFKLANRFGATWDPSTIRRNRLQMGFRCKRTSPYNRASDPVLRNQYKLLWYARGLQVHQCVFMDETHKAGKDFFQRNGFARGSDRAHVAMNGPLTRQFSALAAMSQDGMLGWDITELARSTSATNMVKAMDTIKFLESFVLAVLPALRPYPQKHSVLICDNATLHHDEMRWLEALVESVGAIIIFLPPYACDLNPIEKAFGRIKQYIQDNADEAAYDPIKVLDDAFNSIGPELGMAYCQNMLETLDLC